jgi:hypothetical protein
MNTPPSNHELDRRMKEVERKARFRTTQSAAMPTVGTYSVNDFVWNSAPTIGAGKVLLGWSRLTTGNAHVALTDWSPCYVTTT